MTAILCSEIALHLVERPCITWHAMLEGANLALSFNRLMPSEDTGGLKSMDHVQNC
jgi:hypothetical protein